MSVLRISSEISYYWIRPFFFLSHLFNHLENSLPVSKEHLFYILAKRARLCENKFEISPKVKDEN